MRLRSRALLTHMLDTGRLVTSDRSISIRGEVTMAAVPAGGSPPGGTVRRAPKPRHMGAPVGRILLLRLHRPPQGAREFRWQPTCLRRQATRWARACPFLGYPRVGATTRKGEAITVLAVDSQGHARVHGRSEARKEPTTRLVPPRGVGWTDSNPASAADDALLHRGRPTSQRWCRRWGP